LLPRPREGGSRAKKKCSGTAKGIKNSPSSFSKAKRSGLEVVPAGRLEKGERIQSRGYQAKNDKCGNIKKPRSGGVGGSIFEGARNERETPTQGAGKHYGRRSY